MRFSMWKYLFKRSICVILCLGFVSVVLTYYLHHFIHNTGITTLMNNVREIIPEPRNAALVANRTRVTSPPSGTQMGQAQIDKILSILSKNGNLLVWGLGNDSPFWHDCTDGKVVFLEQSGTPWFTKITDKYPFLEAYEVEYSTDLRRSFERYNDHKERWNELDLRPKLPSNLISIKWNVILVDAPTGYESCKGKCPGRYESILTSVLLARNGTHIFVDDYNRKVERTMSNQMLGKPVEVISRQSGHVEANEQAHFLFNE